jgi:hypothetical protein
MVLLSFTTWINFTSIEDEDTLEFDRPSTSIDLRGSETSRLRDTETIEIDTIQEENEWCSCRVGLGDGYFIAFAGLMIVAASALAFVTGRDSTFGAFIAAVGLGSMLLAGFNAFGDWNAIAWTEVRQTEPVEGSATPMLWALVLVSAMAAVTGAVLWAAARGQEEADGEDEYDDEYQELPERYNAWA